MPGQSWSGVDPSGRLSIIFNILIVCRGSHEKLAQPKNTIKTKRTRRSIGTRVTKKAQFMGSRVVYTPRIFPCHFVVIGLQLAKLCFECGYL